MIDRRQNPERFDEAVDLREIDETHYLAVNLFELRQERGWSQEELADRCGLTQPQIAHLEAGHVNPTIRTLAKLGCALGTSVGKFFFPTELQTEASEPWAEPTWVHVTEYGSFELRSPADARRVDNLTWSAEEAAGEVGEGHRRSRSVGQVNRLTASAA